MVYSFTNITLFAILRLFLRKADGIENIPKKGAFIVAANHESYFDPLLIIATIVPLINKKIHFLAMRGRFWNKFGDKISHDWAGCVPLDKGKEYKALKELKYLLNKKEIIGIFPEGPRSLDGNLRKGKTGISRLVLSAKVHVLPVGLIGTYEIASNEKLIPKLKKANIRIGKPLYFNEYYNKRVTKKVLREITDRV